MNPTEPVDSHLVKILLERLRSDVAEERRQAAAQLTRLQIRARGTVRTRGSRDRSAACPYSAELGREAMTTVLEAFDQAPATEMIAALGEIGDEQAVPILGGIATGDHQNPDPAMRRAAIAALGTLGGPSAFTALCHALYDPAEANRYDALIALDDLILSAQRKSESRTRSSIHTLGVTRGTDVHVITEENSVIVNSLRHLRDNASDREYLRRMAGAVLEQLGD